MNFVYLSPRWYGIYMDTWHEAIREGYTSEDARQLAQLEADSQMQKNGFTLEKCRAPTSGETINEVVKEIVQSSAKTKIEPPPFSFIKPKIVLE